MKKLFSYCVLILLSSLQFSYLYASPSAKELRDICEQEREKNIAPLRDQAIKECMDKQRNTRDYCERFYRDYGESGRTQQGNFRPRMFSDLPECIAASEAEMAEQKANNRGTEPGKKRDTEPGKKRDTEPGKKRDTDDPGHKRDAD